MTFVVALVGLGTVVCERKGRLTPMTSFAVVLRSRIRRVDGVLMILDDRIAANEIAFKLRQRGQDVEVVEYLEPSPPR